MSIGSLGKPYAQYLCLQMLLPYEHIQGALVRYLLQFLPLSHNGVMYFFVFFILICDCSRLGQVLRNLSLTVYSQVVFVPYLRYKPNFYLGIYFQCYPQLY